MDTPPDLELATRAGETRYRLAARIVGLGTWSWDLATDTATFDDRVRELFGFEREDPQPRAEILATRIHPDDRERVAGALSRAADPAGNGLYLEEYRVVRPDGSTRWARAAGKTEFAGEGAERRPVFLVGTVLDVTEEREREAALRAAIREEQAARVAAEAERARLTRVITQLPAPVAIMEGRELRFRAVSEPYRAIIGGRDVLGHPIRRALPELSGGEGGADFFAFLERVYDTGEAVVRTGELARWDDNADGVAEDHFVDLVYSPLRGAGEGEGAGPIEGVTALVLDMTVRVQAEVALRESEARFRAMFDSAGLGAALVGLDGTLLRVNPAFARMLGYTAGEMQARTLAELTHPDDVAADAALAAELFAGERESYRVEKRYTHRDGSVVWAQLTGSLVRGEEGAPLYAIGLVEDVTERRRHAQEREFLAQAGAELASSLDYQATLGTITRLAVQELADWCAVDEPGPDGTVHRIAVAHRDPAKVEFAARYYEKYPMRLDDEQGIPLVLRTGVPELVPIIPDEMIQAVAQDDEQERWIRELDLGSYICVPLVARDQVLGALTFVSGREGRRFGTRDLWMAEQLARRAAVAIDNARLFAESQETRYRLEETATELEAQTEELQAQACQLEDAQVELELSNDELRRANEEAGARAAEAERARAEAEEANRAKSQFLAMMSHELRTPLNAIGGYVDLMDLGIHGPLTGAQRESLDRIRRGQQRLLGLINDVLNFARIEAGQVQYRIEEVPVDEVVRGVGSLMEPLIREKGLHYSYVSAPSLAVRADRERVEQIVLNLLSNAVKFTAEGGVVEVALSESDFVEIQVRDTGRGIPEADLEAIFNPFVQVDANLTRENQGTGLGLAISRDLARAMGGDLRVASTLGAGSTFLLHLPSAHKGRAGALQSG